MTTRPITRETWTKAGFLLAAIGSAVGIGNIWRFPYMVGVNGGGAFLIPYLVGVLVFSLPLMVLELDIGRSLKGSVVTALGRMDRRVRLAGLLPVAISLGVAGYYFVITGWSFAYLLFSAIGYPEFSAFVSGWLPLAFFLATLAITTLVVSFGIEGD